MKTEKSELLDSLRPVLWLTWFSGNSLRSTKEHSKKLMQWSMTAVDFAICLLLVIYAIQLKHVFKIPERNSCKFLIGVSVQLFYSGVALRSCMGLWRKSTSGLHFMTLLESYELKSNRKLISKLKRSNSYLLITSVALLLVMNSLLAMFFLTLVIPKDSILVKVLMLTHHGTDTFAFEVFGFSLLSFSIGCGHLSQLWLLLFFSRLICYEFSTIRRKFRQMTAHDLASEIETIRGEYEQVVRLVAAVEDLLSFNLLFVFSAMVPTTCIFLYALIHQDVEEIDLSVIGAMAFTAVTECVLIVSLGIRINKKVSGLFLFHLCAEERIFDFNRPLYRVPYSVRI